MEADPRGPRRTAAGEGAEKYSHREEKRQRPHPTTIRPRRGDPGLG
jgi:hypothetical protein